MTATTTPCPDCIALEGEPVSADPHGALTAPDGGEGLRDGSLHATYRCRVCGARMAWSERSGNSELRWRFM
jgi:hypothetical protein